MSFTRKLESEATDLAGPQTLPPVSIENSCVSSLEYTCEDCKAVDWDQISKFAANHALNTRQVLIQHASVDKSHAELRTSSCQVCRLLATIKPAFLDTKKCALIATSISMIMGIEPLQPRWKEIPRCTVIGFTQSPYCGFSFDIPENADVGKSGCLAVLGSDVDTLRIKPNVIQPDSIDYNLFRRLMDVLCEVHYALCEPHSDAGDIDLHVIDIWARKIVRAPERCRYIALSYVWGSAGDDASDYVLNSAPLVVQDAISVTASLGCQYLWVDRYCIPRNSSDKHRMISNMDKVYSSAYLTIIAAAGSDAQSGLPGVSKLQRKVTKTLQLGEAVRLQQVYPAPVHLLNATPWASRAWTYQECFLSRWRLIFTKEQVVLLCNNKYFAESLACPIEGKYMGRLHAYKFSHLIRRSRDPLNDKMNGLRDHIHEYSGRTLRYDSDSLNAFLGVLNYHISAAPNDQPISHIWGVPFAIYNKFPSMQWDPKLEAPPSAEFALFWMHEKPATRRDGFPSWSWTGWAGTVRFSDQSVTLSSDGPTEFEQSSRDEGCRSDVQFYVQDDSEQGSDQKKRALAELFRSLILTRQPHHEIDQNPYRRLLVSCLVRPLRCENVELSGAQANSTTLVRFPSNRALCQSYVLDEWKFPRSSGQYAIFQFQEKIHVGTKIYWDEVCDQNAVSCLLLFNHSQSSLTWGSTTVACAFLLVKQVDNDHHQRVGVVIVDIQLPYGSQETIFMDEDGKVLDEVDLSLGFAETPLLSDGKMRNICLI